MIGGMVAKSFGPRRVRLEKEEKLEAVKSFAPQKRPREEWRLKAVQERITAIEDRLESCEIDDEQAEEHRRVLLEDRALVKLQIAETHAAVSALYSLLEVIVDKVSDRSTPTFADECTVVIRLNEKQRLRFETSTPPTNEAVEWFRNASPFQVEMGHGTTMLLWFIAASDGSLTAEREFVRGAVPGGTKGEQITKGFKDEVMCGSRGASCVCPSLALATSILDSCSQSQSFVVSVCRVAE